MFTVGEKKYSFSIPYIMGILNITPDSFSDGGKYNTPELAVSRALELEKQGADFLDIGAQSTRPGSIVISEQEELSRLFPVFNNIRKNLTVPVSVDTFYPNAAEEVLEHGADIINDVSGRSDDEMLRIVKSFDASIIIMHTGSDLKSIVPFFETKLNQAEKIGLEKEKICFDPGIGFGKSQEDNIKIIRNVQKFKIAGMPVLIGLSKKSVLSFCCNDNRCDKASATIAANVIALLNGADILRVHDVKQNVDAVKTVNSILKGGDYNF